MAWQSRLKAPLLSSFPSGWIFARGAGLGPVNPPVLHQIVLGDEGPDISIFIWEGKGSRDPLALGHDHWGADKGLCANMDVRQENATNKRKKLSKELTRNIVVPRDRFGSLHGAERVEVPPDPEVLVLPSFTGG